MIRIGYLLENSGAGAVAAYMTLQKIGELLYLISEPSYSPLIRLRAAEILGLIAITVVIGNNIYREIRG